MSDSRIARRRSSAKELKWGRLHCRIDPELHMFLSDYAERHNMPMRLVIEQLLARLRDLEGMKGVQQV